MTRDYDPDLLEIGDTGDCIYLHAENCPGYCGYACNGLLGDRAASEIEARWKANDFTDAERADINRAREVVQRALAKHRAEGAASAEQAPSRDDTHDPSARPRDGQDAP